MKYVFLLLIFITTQAYGYGYDDLGHSLEEQRMRNEAQLQTMQREAQRQRTWKMIYNRLQEIYAPKEVVLPLYFKRNLDIDFLFQLSKDLVDRKWNELGEVIHITNCWHGWGTEIVQKYKWTKICLKYGKMSNEYIPLNTKHVNEYYDAIDRLR